MRRAIYTLLRCSKCRQGPLAPETGAVEVLFGPMRCARCHATYPVSEGVLDLLTEPRDPRPIQRGFEQPWVARAYERYLRAGLQLALSRKHFDRESEFLIYRSLLGQPLGPVLDLGCGTGVFARRLAGEDRQLPVVGLDVSKAMIEEAVAQARESGTAVDYVRAEAPELPFLDATLGGILQSRAMSFVEDLDKLFAEVARVLLPGGRFVAGTHLPPRLAGLSLQNWAGLYPRTEEQLRQATARAGLDDFERVLIPPFVVIKVERPTVAAAAAGR